MSKIWFYTCCWLDYGHQKCDSQKNPKIGAPWKSPCHVPAPSEIVRLHWNMCRKMDQSPSACGKISTTNVEFIFDEKNLFEAPPGTAIQESDRQARFPRRRITLQANRSSSHLEASAHRTWSRDLRFSLGEPIWSDISSFWNFAIFENFPTNDKTLCLTRNDLYSKCRRSTTSVEVKIRIFEPWSVQNLVLHLL